jgi:outer membrane autotransporter protein
MTMRVQARELERFKALGAVRIFTKPSDRMMPPETLRALADGSAPAGDLRPGDSAGAVSGNPYSPQCLIAFAALGLIALTSPGQAQAPPLGTTASFAVLAGSAITNTGPTVITGTAALPGNIGVSPGSSITGFFTVDGGPGILTGPGATTHQNDAAAIQAQVDLTTAYNSLAGRVPTANLTGQNLGGLTLVPGVYNFSSSAQLTGHLTLNGLGNPNAVFIFNIGSTLTTASASSISLINGAQGGDVFWRVGSSATLGSTTSFTGDILAQTSITLNAGADITCGAAWARTGAVTLDDSTISLCNLLAAGGVGGPVLGPTGVPLFASLLPSSASTNQHSVANGLDTFSSDGGALTLPFLNLLNLSPSNLAAAMTQLSGEAVTGTPQAGFQVMNSFLTLVTNPFADNRGFTPQNQPVPPLFYKAPVYKASPDAMPDPRRWDIWAAAYGGQNNTGGDILTGSHDTLTRTFGYATGLDYRVTPYTVAGFALAGGSTNYGLSDGLGGGHSDMFQSAVYSLTRVNAAYVSAALAYSEFWASTSRTVTVAGLDQLNASFDAQGLGGRIEGGYRFIIPGVFDLPQFGFTPYAALQGQAFHTPSYSESAAFGSPQFALAYDAHTTTTTRTELGAWFDRTTMLDNGAMLALRTRAAWAHDFWSDLSSTATFQALPGSSFTVFGATPAHDSFLVSAVAEIGFNNGISLAGKFDSELAQSSQTYIGTARLRYMW